MKKGAVFGAITVVLSAILAGTGVLRPEEAWLVACWAGLLGACLVPPVSGDQLLKRVIVYLALPFGAYLFGLKLPLLVADSVNYRLTAVGFLAFYFACWWFLLRRRRDLFPRL